MYYYNGAGQRFILPERPLEPPDCWAEEEPEEVQVQDQVQDVDFDLELT